MVPLTVRSNYSFMWGTAAVKQVCRAARRLGYTHLALTDTDNLCGLWPFLTGCRREGLTPIVGAEVSDPRHKQRAVCLVENDTGYRYLNARLSYQASEQIKVSVLMNNVFNTIYSLRPGLLEAPRNLTIRISLGCS